MIFDSWNADGYTLRPEDKELIEAKLSKLTKFNSRVADESVKVHTEVVRGTRHNSPNFGIRVTLTIPGDSLRAEASGKTIADAIDEIERKLKAQIEKLKD